MNHFVKASVATAVILGTSLVAGSAFAGIANTRHNLGAPTGPNSTDGTGEICIFCHTPHGGSTEVGGVKVAVPLWNKALTTAVFTTYDQLGTSTLDAGVGPVGSVSLACLTCHDGTQAIDNIINAPGSGGYDRTGGGVGGLDWTWATDGTLDTTGRFTGSVDDGGTNANIWEIGTDLTNDHPVSMQYAGGGYSFTNQVLAQGATLDEDFAAASRIGTAGRWYVDNTIEGTPGSFDKWDFKLYTRDTTGFADNPNNGAVFAGEKEPFVECGSCHDPHFETTTFLRMSGQVNLVTDLNGGVAPAGAQSNTGSRVCLTCHTK
ncbi:MAG: cytochrome c3 family protein [Porticoccus sp.]|nr:cytochrome c3 family protein [Porticoccus sp.]